MLPTDLLLILYAYLLGSICSAILISRFLRLPDPRLQGSYNPGASNVFRSGGIFPAALTFAFDLLKGFIPVLVSLYIGADDLVISLTAVAACLGHIFPIYFSFKGGKAVATAIGVIFAFDWALAMLLLLIWGIVLKLTRYASLAAVLTVGLAPVLCYFWINQFFYPVLSISGLIITRHLDNLKRLFKGREARIIASD